MRDVITGRRAMIGGSALGLLGAGLGVDRGAWAAKPAHPVGAGFNVRDYGAKGDGKALDTAAINRAIEAGAAAGGGTVLFPAGNFLSFSIRLKSRVHLNLAQGAVLIAADSPLPGQTT